MSVQSDLLGAVNSVASTVIKFKALDKMDAATEAVKKDQEATKQQKENFEELKQRIKALEEVNLGARKPEEKQKISLYDSKGDIINNG